MVTLIKGCILFYESGDVEIVDFESVELFKDIDTADENGAEYLDNGGDSYVVLESIEGKIIWDKVAKSQYLKTLK